MQISEIDKPFFIEGIYAHSRYVKFCMHTDEIMNFDINFRKYLDGKLEGLPNKAYASFDDFVKP